MFAEADATGAAGALDKELGVVSIPLFVLFRNGVWYGAISTSKLPWDRLNMVIRALGACENFDTSLEEEEDD